MILVFDTETTGKLDFKRAPEAEGQPRLVQLGAILFSDEGRVLAQVDLMVRPDGFEIPGEVVALHGIDQALALAAGVSVKGVLSLFRKLVEHATVLVAYNCEFDRAIMDGEYARAGAPQPWRDDHIWKDPMKVATGICKLPGKYGDYKWPKLSEAYRTVTGKEMEGGHNAMVDVKATAELYFAMKLGGMA